VNFRDWDVHCVEIVKRCGNVWRVEIICCGCRRSRSRSPRVFIGPTAVRISVGAGASSNIPVSCRNYIVHPVAIYHRTGE
jgi:hypothetical protein